MRPGRRPEHRPGDARGPRNGTGDMWRAPRWWPTTCGRSRTRPAPRNGSSGSSAGSTGPMMMRCAASGAACAAMASGRRGPAAPSWRSCLRCGNRYLETTYGECQCPKGVLLARIWLRSTTRAAARWTASTHPRRSGASSRPRDGRSFPDSSTWRGSSGNGELSPATRPGSSACGSQWTRTSAPEQRHGPCRAWFRGRFRLRAAATPTVRRGCTATAAATGPAPMQPEGGYCGCGRR